jgi:hypothetical protein
MNGVLTVKNPNIAVDSSIYTIQAATSTSQLSSWTINQNTDVVSFGTDYFGALSLKTNSVERYNIGTTGISTWSVAGTTAMTLNSTGLGIGASPSATLDIRKNAAGGRFLSYHTGGNGTLTAATDLNEMRSDDTTTAYNLLNVNPVGSSRFLVKSTGDVVIGATAGDLLVGTASTGVGKVYIRRDSLTAPVIQVGNESLTGQMMTFRTAGDTQVGSISFTNVAVAYNTSSDYRLKESVKSISGGLARVNALKPSSYQWKVDGSAGEGFLAHELAEVVPFAVTGDKDAVDADGKPAYQGVDLSKLVPILVAAIQELTAEVNALKNA